MIRAPFSAVPLSSCDRPRRHVRGGRRRVAGQQTSQAQAPEHGGRGRANPPAVPAPLPATPAAVCARVRGTPPARLVVAHAVHAHVAVRPGPVAGPLRSDRGKVSAPLPPSSHHHPRNQGRCPPQIPASHATHATFHRTRRVYTMITATVVTVHDSSLTIVIGEDVPTVTVDDMIFMYIFYYLFHNILMFYNVSLDDR